MRALIPLVLVCVACSPTIRDDYYTCDLAADEGCPSGFECVAGRCVRDGAPRDAGADGRSDASTDASTDAAVECPNDCEDENPCTGGCDAECNPTPLTGTNCGAGLCCSGVCVFDNDTNPLACGLCEVCAPDEECQGGACVCATGTTLCGGACVNTNTDPMHCGMCGEACAGLPCNGGACVACANDGDCDDDLDCTNDSCLPSGECENVLSGDFCLIEGACVESRARSEGNPCLVCDPSDSALQWTAAEGDPCNDANACTSGDSCNDFAVCVGQGCGQCEVCMADSGCEPRTGSTCVHPDVPCAVSRCEAGACVPDVLCEGLDFTSTPGGTCVSVGGGGFRQECRRCGNFGDPCCADYSEVFDSGVRDPCGTTGSCNTSMTCL